MGGCFGVPVGHKTPPSSKSNSDAIGKESKQRTVTQIVEEPTQKLKLFSLEELRSATSNFRADSQLGEGGFGKVFKGWVNETTLAPSKFGEGLAIAVKKSSPDSQQGLKEWQAEVHFLGKFAHPNLVRLVGYCNEDHQYLLVYEYVEKGSLENYIFNNVKEQLSWETRLKIAIGAARGLDLLHRSENTVIYRDFKAANILLDENYNAKLSDFGLAKFGPSGNDTHVSTNVMGTYGYCAPEYMTTGHLYVKSDVYGFGVVLLELLSGRRVLDNNRPSSETNLLDWSKPFIEKKKLHKIIDPRFGDQYSPKGVSELVQLIVKCLDYDHKKRPSMEELLRDLERIGTMKDLPKHSKASAKQHMLSHQ